MSQEPNILETLACSPEKPIYIVYHTAGVARTYMISPDGRSIEIPEGHEDPSGVKIKLAYCYQAYGDATFRADGEAAMSAQAEIVTEHIRSSAKIKIAQYVGAVSLTAMAGTCIIFAPAGREVAADIIGAAFVLVGAGIAGIGRFNIKMPFIKMHASMRPQNLSSEKPKRLP